MLPRLRQALASAYSDKLVRAVLFGSRARARGMDALSDSDDDVAVFLHRSEGLWPESDRLANIVADILDETGVVVDTSPSPPAPSKPARL